jgi:NAD(P)-dependent dehydrogenase (short-subunit alcohol dehydrogenase family)
MMIDRDREDVRGQGTQAKARFSGRTIFITGGSSGIGLSTAIRFLEEGANVAIMARGDERLEQARIELEAIAGAERVDSISGDVRDEQSVINAFERVIDRFESLDVVVNNAGTIAWGSVDETTLETWQEMIDVHCTGYFLVARQAVRVFKQSKRPGTLVFVVSDNAIKPSRNLLAYNVAKAAELHMARCIADECGPFGIRVNSILPGAVFGRSEFWTKKFRASRAAIHGFDPDNLEEEYKKNTALGVIIYPEEVADLILFLASDQAAKITGAVVSIDGGGKAGFVR